MDIREYLKSLVSQEGSDLFITANLAPMIKCHGELKALQAHALTAEEAREAVHTLMDESLNDEFRRSKEANFAYVLESIGRFRVSAYVHRGEYGMVIRRISEDIPTLGSLGIPPSLKKIIMKKRGLVLIVGATGHGKTTTLSSLMDYRNQTSASHIISFEDPIEYVHQHKKSIFTQREIGIDTESYQIGLKNALRQSPDVINISEVRCAQTMEAAINFAQTGHLCLATLHANNANEALDRVIHFFPESDREQIWLDLSLNLHAIIAQRLIPNIEGGRSLALEIMINTPTIATLIRKGEVERIKEYMGRKNQYGMQTFDQALFNLVQQNKVGQEEALKHADSVNNLRLMFKLANKDVTDNPNQAHYSIQDPNNPDTTGLDL